MHKDSQIQIIQILNSIVGNKRVITKARDTKRFRTGIRVGEGAASAVVFPGDLIQLWKVIQACIEFNKILIIQAANTGLTGGSTPDGYEYDRDIVIINTRFLDELVLLQGGKQVLAFPGATLSKLEKILEPLNREPHSIIGSSCIGASVVGGVCNNSGGNLIKRGPAYTELSLYARVNSKGQLELINHLGIELGSSPEEILTNLQEKRIDCENLPITKRKASDDTYKYLIRDFKANTPARFNSDKNRLYEASGCAGKVIVFAVRLDTFEQKKNKKVFYIGTNKPSIFTSIRKRILSDFKELPEMAEYMHNTSFDGAEKYGKDTFLLIKFFGKEIIPLLFRLKVLFDSFFSSFPIFFDEALDKILHYTAQFLPNHLPLRVREYRSKFEHHLILVASEGVVLEVNSLLQELQELQDGDDCFDYFVCKDQEDKDVLLHRYVAGIAPKRFKLLNRESTGELLPLDVALPRNCEFWNEIITDEIISKSIESFQMAHFMCMVFHWDFVLKKEVELEAVKSNILQKLDEIKAKYPAEHNVGHLYKADKDLSKFYRDLDPLNNFNPGIGKLSKRKFYK